ncbi:MAG: hypothetical protein JWO38_3262 [Gemmataceae bacterium]|nr:hypothetical protein [Gemmataceae bacterium]
MSLSRIPRPALPGPSRRDALRAFSAGAAAASVAPWFAPLARAAARDPARKRSCILLWMSGGPSTIDLFDLKPRHENGGPFKPIATAAPGVMIGEHLPKVAAHAKHLAVVRSMATREGDHARATFHLRTGNLPQGGIDFPCLGSLLAKELHDPAAALPPFVSIAPQRVQAQGAFGPGFLGPRYAPLLVADGQQVAAVAQLADLDRVLKVQDLTPPGPGTPAETDARLALMTDLEAEFLAARPGLAAEGHRSAYAAAVRLMKADAGKAFDLSAEPVATRDKYGKTLFGQGCLLARRLVERGVPFVEVTLASAAGAPAGWDTHGNNFDQVKALAGVLDRGWAALMDDLTDRGLLDTTTIVWMGEFGRTPKINPQKGRDHFAAAWSTVIGGGGIAGGRVVGKTSPDGTTVEDRPVSVPDLLATVCKALGIDHEKQNLSNVNRPIRIVDKTAKPLTEVLA